MVDVDEHDERVDPKPSLLFYLKNIGTLIKLKRANYDRMDKFVKTTRYLEEPIIPTPEDEGTGGPMEEGMIYVMFNAQDPGSPLYDCVWRLFWVNAPSLNMSFVDSYFISEQFESNQWEKYYPHLVFVNHKKDNFHQEVKLDDQQYQMVMDGTWDTDYDFTFNDPQNNIKGTLRFEPLDPKGVLFYYNARTAISPSMAQRFYDAFAIKITGEVEVNGQLIQITNGRGIIEHGKGIFSNFHIYDWRWLNVSFPEGVVHLFYHSLDLREIDGKIFVSGEGAAVMNGEWVHFPPGSFKIEEVGFSEETNLRRPHSVETKIPTTWHVTAGKDESGQPLLDLKMSESYHMSWPGALGKELQYITNYIMVAEGTWRGKPVKGKGTMENQMHRVID